jgi:hypothetical protein
VQLRALALSDRGPPSTSPCVRFGELSERRADEDENHTRQLRVKVDRANRAEWIGPACAAIAGDPECGDIRSSSASSMVKGLTGAPQGGEEPWLTRRSR